MTQNGTAAWLKMLLSFVTGVLTTIVVVLSLARPTMERIADERAAVVEQRTSSQMLLLEESRRREYEALRSEIRELRAELLQLIKEVRHQ